MLRIAIGGDGRSRLALRLEGALIGAWVTELGQLCEPAIAAGATVTLDLGDVSFVGRDGVLLLASLRGQGVALLNCTPLVAEQLKAHAHTHGERA